MTPREKAQITVATEAQFRATLYEVLAKHTDNEEEKIEIAGAVLALMLRKMTQERGHAWLETILTMVLQPE